MEKLLRAKSFFSFASLSFLCFQTLTQNPHAECPQGKNFVAPTMISKKQDSISRLEYFHIEKTLQAETREARQLARPSAWPFLKSSAHLT